MKKDEAQASSFLSHDKCEIFVYISTLLVCVFLKLYNVTITTTGEYI